MINENLAPNPSSNQERHFMVYLDACRKLVKLDRWGRGQYDKAPWL